MILCERCQTQPPQLQGGWYSEDNGQWVSCKACDDLKAASASAGLFGRPLDGDLTCGPIIPMANPFKKGGPYPQPILPSGRHIVSYPYAAIDLETTGLDPSWCQILEIGVVIDDWKSSLDKLRRFHCYLLHDRYIGDPFALSMPGNQVILHRIANRKKPENKEFNFYTPAEAVCMLKDFLMASYCMLAPLPQPKIIAAGKNYGRFDDRFLSMLPGYAGLNILHRNIDPGMLYWDPTLDQSPPDTKTCLMRAGFDTEVQHDAINDSLDVIRLIRTSVGIPV